MYIVGTCSDKYLGGVFGVDFTVRKNHALFEDDGTTARSTLAPIVTPAHFVNTNAPVAQASVTFVKLPTQSLPQKNPRPPPCRS